MDMLQEQVNILSTKVEALTQRIDQLSTKVSEVVVECKFGPEHTNRYEAGIGTGYRSHLGTIGMNASMEHKDILSDSDGLDSVSQSGERQLSPEVQIQRLTAQLTAAYNRIAALEEQLLSKRVFG